jgi:hypothetical protein
MNKLQIRRSLGFILLLLLVQAPAGIWAVESLSLRYREAAGDQVRVRRFSVEPSGERVSVQSSVEGKMFFTECDISGDTRRWQVDADESDFQAVRSGNTIAISGTARGKSVDKKLTKDERPWFQSLYYSLSRFVVSDKESLEFWMIRPDNLSLVRLRAEKEGVETIRIHGRAESVQKVRLEPAGLFSYIWHGYYWYRKEDGVLLQYKDMKALPGRNKLSVRLCRTSKDPEADQAGMEKTARSEEDIDG